MIGNQKPRINIYPAFVDSDGDKAADLMRAYGVTLDEWQSDVVRVWLGTDEAGNYVTTSAGLSIPRQNGKNVCIEAREFYGLVVNGERILHTAHQVRTTKKAFRRLVNMFTNKKHPEVVRMVKQIRYGVGEESIELENGGIIEFTSRSRQTARGYDGISLVVYDEAQEVTDDNIEALMSVLSASITGTRQIIYAGTPPYPGCPGTVFRRFREGCINEAGRGEITHSSWIEWSVTEDSVRNKEGAIDVSNRALWYEANPALGSRLTEEFTAEEYKTMSADGFGRERLGLWFKPNEHIQEKVIDPAKWEACMSEEMKPEGKTAYGVKFSIDGSFVVLAGAVIGNDGISRISVIEIKPMGHGVSWLVEWLNARYKKASCVVVDGKNGADLLIDKIKPVWVFKDSVIKPSAQNMITAAALLINEINEQSVTWYKGQEALNESAITATKRAIGGGWGFGGAGSEIIEACSLALWGCRNSKRNPLKVMKIG